MNINIYYTAVAKTSFSQVQLVELSYGILFSGVMHVCMYTL